MKWSRFAPGQRLLLRSGKFAHYERPVFRLDGEIIEISLADGSARFVNVRDVMVTDWDGTERRQGERRQGQRRRRRLPYGPRLERRRHRERRQKERRGFVLTNIAWF